MKYKNLIDNFVVIVKFDECRCSPINLINLGFNLLYYCHGFVDKLCNLINLKILINYITIMVLKPSFNV